MTVKWGSVYHREKRCKANHLEWCIFQLDIAISGSSTKKFARCNWQLVLTELEMNLNTFNLYKAV